MWNFDGPRARLDLSKVKSDFKRTYELGLTLINPKRNMWDWSKEELFLRSVVIDEENYVVSCGWPKFGNYGEFINDTETLKNDLEKKSLVNFTHKEDGSLCIRFVYKDTVFFRTRGTLFGGEKSEDNPESFKERFFRTANKYPKLLDPNWMNDRSLLFEYVSPTNTVVVRYKEEDFIFIGFVDHCLNIGKFNELKQIAEEGNLNLVRVYKFPNDPIKIIETVKTWKEEGIVARCNGDQTLVKIKSVHYLAQHRMKFSINYKFMVEFVNLSGIKTENELIKELKDCEYDYEIIETSIPFFRKYIENLNYIDGQIEKAKEILENFNLNKYENEKIRRKEFASLVCKTKISSFAFLLYDNKLDKLNNLKRKLLINENCF